jgi:hypothetical protein
MRASGFARSVSSVAASMLTVMPPSGDSPAGTARHIRSATTTAPLASVSRYAGRGHALCFDVPVIAGDSAKREMDSVLKGMASTTPVLSRIRWINAPPQFGMTSDSPRCPGGHLPRGVPCGGFADARAMASSAVRE